MNARKLAATTAVGLLLLTGCSTVRLPEKDTICAKPKAG